jgi:hypothetical protein
MRGIAGILSVSIAIGVMSAGVAACSKRERDGGGAPVRAVAAVDAGQPVDTETMAFLSEARALHHEANVKEQENDVRGAIAAVERIVRTRRPHAGDRDRVPEIEEVLADAFARIAELELRAGDVGAASRAANEGLGHATEATYFRGHLLEVQGIVEETRAATLADAGDARAAAAARVEATRLLEEAVGVQERVIGEALGEGRDAGDAREGGAR